jgi:hypothetical protein
VGLRYIKHNDFLVFAESNKVFEAVCPLCSKGKLEWYNYLEAYNEEEPFKAECKNCGRIIARKEINKGKEL